MRVTRGPACAAAGGANASVEAIAASANARITNKARGFRRLMVIAGLSGRCHLNYPAFCPAAMPPGESGSRQAQARVHAVGRRDDVLEPATPGSFISRPTMRAGARGP